MSFANYWCLASGIELGDRHGSWESETSETRSSIYVFKFVHIRETCATLFFAAGLVLQSQVLQLRSNYLLDRHGALSDSRHLHEEACAERLWPARFASCAFSIHLLWDVGSNRRGRDSAVAANY